MGGSSWESSCGARPRHGGFPAPPATLRGSRVRSTEPNATLTRIGVALYHPFRGYGVFICANSQAVRKYRISVRSALELGADRARRGCSGALHPQSALVG